MAVADTVGASTHRRITSISTAVAGLVVCVASGAAAQFTIPSTNVISGTVSIIDRNGDEVKNRSDVVVFIDGLHEAEPRHSVPKPPQVSHLGRQFSPVVLPVVRGTTVDFFNDDDIYHNVFSLSQALTFDLGIYPQGTSKLVIFPETGLVRIHCNIHPKMTSNILVLNNSLFAITGPDGHFEIKGIPDGQLTLRVWSEFSKEQSRSVSLRGGGTFEESFDIRETKQFVQHRNKFGKRYREKY